MEKNTENKLVLLKKILAEMGKVLVAYSGGVDSSFLASVANEVLRSNSLAVFASSPLSPPGEREEAESFARRAGFRLKMIETHEMEDPNFLTNPPERCYYCKKELFQVLQEIARSENITWIADGTNADDLSDYRPGRRACLEAGVRSPLLEAGLTKDEIRLLSRQKGLPTWDRPASPCLASRIPYGTRITPEILTKIAAGEKYLHSLGLRQLRLRHHGEIARLEIDIKDICVVLQDKVREDIVQYLKSLGYRYITLDLSGYRTGSLNPLPSTAEI